MLKFLPALLVFLPRGSFHAFRLEKLLASLECGGQGRNRTADEKPFDTSTRLSRVVRSHLRLL